MAKFAVESPCLMHGPGIMHTTITDIFVRHRRPLAATPDYSTLKSDSRFDMLKVGLALMIVILHTKLFPGVALPVVRIAVPLFFMMSAYFFFGKVYAAADSKTQWGILWKFEKRSLLLYLFWFVALLPVTLWLRGRMHAPNDVLTLLKSGLFGSTFMASWFIMACVIGMSIIFLMRRHLGLCAIISAALYGLCCMQTSYYNLFTEFNRWMSGAIPGISSANSFPAGMIWLTAGAWAARFKGVNLSRTALLATLSAAATGIALLFAEYHFTTTQGWLRLNDCFLSLMVCCPPLFLLVMSAPAIRVPGLVALRHATVVVYCSHASLAFGLLPVMAHYHIHQPQQGITVFLITIIATGILSAAIICLSRCRGFRWLKIAC